LTCNGSVRFLYWRLMPSFRLLQQVFQTIKKRGDEYFDEMVVGLPVRRKSKVLLQLSYGPEVFNRFRIDHAPLKAW
jgi:hypothetical protein